MEQVDQTYIMVKPDGVKRGLVGEIIARFEKKGFKLAGLKLFQCPKELAEITEKSDVYSYGVVVLEVLTGKQPIDTTIPDGLPVADWVRQKRGGIEVLDSSLLSKPGSEIEEIMQALGIALFCVNSSPDERPTMNDVAAMLKEIKHEREEYAKVDVLLKGSPTATDHNNVQENSKNLNAVSVTSSSNNAAAKKSCF